MITHKEVVDLLKLTMLIYNYGNEISVKKSVGEKTNVIYRREKIVELNDIRLEAYNSLCKESPEGNVIKFINDENTDLQAAITISHSYKRISVIFRGTESFSDWYYNLIIFKKWILDKVYVHNGFYNQLTKNNAYGDLSSTLKSVLIEYPEYKIYTSGHSLGGALATLFGFMISHEIDNHVTIISYASPRVGDYRWKKAVLSKSNLSHYRVTNECDIVTSIPLIGYKHVGTVIHLTPKHLILNRLYGWYSYTLLRCWSIAAHSCELYYQRIVKYSW